ncbi:DUF416 family protein [Luteibacter sp. NPDC031894]|uniref:DUF416 family protein n=1 Tax=Luteibacter sp. NPDC031894 TaxID=3390572 RepID=UPI003D06CE9D
MTEYEDRFRWLLSELRSRPFLHQLAFGICIFERSLPGYFQFQQETGWHGGAELRAVLAKCWSVLEGGKNTNELCFTTNVEDCARWMPESERFDSPYTSAAIDTANIACCLLEYLDASDFQFILEAAEARRDTIYLYVQNSMPGVLVDESLQRATHEHPLMMEELSFMSGDLDELADLSTKGAELSTGLLKRIRAMRYSDLRLK